MNAKAVALRDEPAFGGFVHGGAENAKDSFQHPRSILESGSEGPNQS